MIAELQPITTAEVYHLDFRADSNSSLRLFEESIEKYAAIRVFGTMEPSKPTNAMILGTQLHLLLFGGDEAIDQEYEVSEGPINPKTQEPFGERTKAFAEWREELQKTGKQWMSGEQLNLLLKMRDGIMRNKDARAFIEQDGVCEYRIDWTNTATGLPMKCRFDKVLSNGLKGDLKTTDDVSPEAFARTILNYSYHCQQDLYDEGGATKGIDGPFLFIAVSKSPPHECAVYILEDPVWMILAREKNLQTMQELAQCRATGDWRGRHSRELNRVPVPAWAAKLTANGPTFRHTKALQTAHGLLSAETAENWIWWNIPQAARRKTKLADLIEENPASVPWHTPEETERLLAMMTGANRNKVAKAIASGGLHVGAIYKRTRADEKGVKHQRAEVRFDELSGCLRTSTGGSSRQVLLIVKGTDVRSRLISSRETARLMGLPDEYELPERYNEAYHLTGDGVVVPVVRHLAEKVFEPVLSMIVSKISVVA